MLIGNHYPEFEFERAIENLQASVARMKIEYPVVQDNDRVNWSAYNNRYWPTLYLIDKLGNLRYTHIGEGSYAEIEAAVKILLAEEYLED